MRPQFVIILSEQDPVARALAEHWGTLPGSGEFVDGAPLRLLTADRWTLRRAVHHTRDDHLDRLLPSEIGSGRIPIIFPSIHWSEGGPRCFTTHPLGNLGDSAEVGGAPQALVTSSPGWMTGALRALHELAPRAGLTASFEATHHGPALDAPAFFLEVGGGPVVTSPTPAEVEVLDSTLRGLTPSSGDRIALGAGGGHYAPHFTDLALRRRWSFGHLIPRHAVESISAASLEQAWAATPGCEGIVYARAQDANRPPWSTIGRRLRDQDAPRRGEER